MFLVFLIIYDTMHLSPRRGEFKFLDRRVCFVKKGRRKGKTCMLFFLFDVTNANTSTMQTRKFSFVKKMNQQHHSSSESSFPPPPHHHGKTNKTTISTHVIDALDEFYGVRRERRTTTMDDNQRGGLIEEEDMNEFDEDVVCLSFENNTINFEKKKKEDGKQLTTNNNNGIIDDDDDDDKRNTMMMRATKTNNDKTTQTIKSSKTGLFDGIHNGIFSIGRGVSTGAQFLGDTVVSGVAVTTNASLYLGKTTVNIGKDAVMHSFNAISPTLITTATTTMTTTPSDVDEELIDDMSNVLLSEAPPRPRGLSIETILLDATTNTKRIATTTTTATTLASSSLATCMCLCGNRIEKAKMEQRVCSYLRVVVCESCFSGDTRIIPRDVLHRWDFTEKPVCKQSLRFLEDAYAIPVISLRKLGEVNRYYYSTSISSKEEFTRLRGFLDLQIKVASLFHRVGEMLRLHNMEKDDEGKKEDDNDDNDDTDDDDASKNKKRNRKALLHFLASIPDDKRRLVRGGDDAKVSIEELKELHEFRKQSEICEYLSAIEDEVVNVLESSL